LYVLYDIVLWAGVLLLFLGYIIEYRKHLFRSLGFVILGVFWITLAPNYIGSRDYFNLVLVSGALPVFLYFAYHEYLSLRWDEDPAEMKFLAGTTSIAMISYFGIQRIPVIAGTLIKVVTEQTTWITSLLGYDFYAGSINYGGNPLWYRTSAEFIYVPVEGTNINIILACTGLQALAAAVALVWCTRAEMKRKLKSLLVLAPVIYVANLVRNVLVIYLTVEDITSFDVAHNQIAKTFSVVVLIILMLAVFEMMPELFDNIMGILKLPERRAKKDDGPKDETT